MYFDPLPVSVQDVKMAGSRTRIAELASIVAENTAKVDEYLRANNLPTPSFDVDAPAQIPIPPDATDIEAARRNAVEASTELNDLLQGSTALLRPNVRIFNTCRQATSPHDTAAEWLEPACHLHIQHRGESPDTRHGQLQRPRGSMRDPGSGRETPTALRYDLA